MTDPRPKFIVLRPADRWDRTREALTPLGIDMVFADVLTYIPTHTPLPPLTGVHALIITSQRAVTSLKEIPDGLKTLPVFVVGTETARALRELGFTGPQTVAPTAESLAPLVTDHTPAHQHFLYLRGADVAVQFRKIIKNHVILEHTAYRGLPKSGLPDDVIKALNDPATKGILFFSRETTRAFADMAERADLIPNFSTRIALCLSPAVLGSLHPETFKQTVVADTPDLIGMSHAVRACLHTPPEDTQVTEASAQSIDPESSPNNMIANADTIIERFGGIRPMANKLGVPVTTVQGWKKRGVIPANRAALIEQAASTHGVETTGLIHIISGNTTTHITLPAKPSPAKSTEAPAPTVEKTDPVDTNASEPVAAATDEDVTIDPDDLSSDKVQEILNSIADAIDGPEENEPFNTAQQPVEKPTEKIPANNLVPFTAPNADDSAPKKSTTQTTEPKPAAASAGTRRPFFNRRKSDKIARATWLAVIMLATAIIVGLIAMTPGITRIKDQNAEIKTLAADISHLTKELESLRRENALLSGLVPRDLKDRMGVLQERAKNIETTVATLGTQTKALTAGVMGEGEGSIEGRLSNVETKLGDVQKTFASEHMARFVLHLATLETSEGGPVAIEQLVQTMYGAMPVDATPAAFGPAFKSAIELTPDLQALFSHLSADEQRQAALLLILSHMRHAVQQDRATMDQDVQLLSLIIPDQKQILNDLAPFAKDGVRSIKGLSADFKVMADNATDAMFKDKSLSWTRRLWAGLHNKLRIERNGEPLTGTETQRILDRAARAIDQNDIALATTTLQSLTGEPAKIAAPWVQDAEQTLRAQDKIVDLTKIISATISLDPASAAIINGLSPKSNLSDIAKGMADSMAPVAQPPLPKTQTKPTMVKE